MGLRFLPVCLLTTLVLGGSAFAVTPQQMAPKCWSVVTHLTCVDWYQTFCEGQLEPVCHTGVDTCGGQECIEMSIGTGCKTMGHELDLPRCSKFDPIYEGPGVPILPPFPSLRDLNILSD